MTAPVLLHGITGDALAAATRSPDLEDQTIRVAARGEVIVTNLFNGMAGLAAEGSYWVAATATPGSGITLSSTTGNSFSDTAGFLVVNNTESSSGSTGGAGQGRSIYLDFVTIVVTTAPGSATSEHVAHRIDAGNRGSAGTTLTPHPVHMGFGGGSIAQVLAFPTIAAASNSVRNMGRNVLRSVIPVVSDIYTIRFGSQEMAAGGASVAQAAANVISVFAPQVVIAPGQCYVMNEWSPARATTAIAGEVYVGWYER